MPRPALHLSPTAGSPTGVVPALDRTPSNPGAGTPLSNASPECRAILWERQPLETMVAGARQQIAFHEKNLPNDYAAQELAFNRTLLADAVADLATFDLTRLTDECRERLTTFGVTFTQSMQAAADAARRTA